MQSPTQGTDLAASLLAGQRSVAGVFQAPFGSDGVLRVTALAGQWGEEFLVEPFGLDGGVSLTAAPEYHLTIPGALRGPIIYRSAESQPTHDAGWSAGQDDDLTAWLTAVPFGADSLPTSYVGDTGTVAIETVLQLHPIDQNLSSLIFTVGGRHQAVDLGPYFEVAERLLAAAAQSYASRPMRPIEAPRFADVVFLGRQGQLERVDSALAADTRSAPVAAVPVSAEVPALAEVPASTEPVLGNPAALPADQVGPAIVARLGPLAGKRILVQDGAASIPTKVMANILKKVAPGVEQSEIIAFLDTGIRAGGKAGLAFTSQDVHICEMNERRVVRLDQIVALNQLGRKVEITTTAGSDPADLIRVDVFGVDEAVVAALEAATGVEATATLERPGF